MAIVFDDALERVFEYEQLPLGSNPLALISRSDGLSISRFGLGQSLVGNVDLLHQIIQQRIMIDFPPFAAVHVILGLCRLPITRST